MTGKPTYEELGESVKQLEKKVVSFQQIETSLRESEATLKSIFRAAPTGILKNLLTGEPYPGSFEMFWIIHDENELRFRTLA